MEEAEIINSDVINHQEQHATSSKNIFAQQEQANYWNLLNVPGLSANDQPDKLQYIFNELELENSNLYINVKNLTILA